MRDYRLETFMEVYRTGSFSKAAVELDVTQPAVSRNIAELEKSIGVKLFVRSKSALEITPAGKIFLHYAQRILDGYAALDSAFAPESKDVATLDIYFSSSLREILSRNVLSLISVLRPNLSVNIVDDISLAGISIIGEPDKSANDTGIKINIHVFPQDHPLTDLVSQAIELSRCGNVL